MKAGGVSAARHLFRQARPWLEPWAEYLQVVSVRSAVKKQGLAPWVDKLKAIVPDLVDQYVHRKTDTEAKQTRVRALHAFQMRLACRAIDRILGDPGAEPLPDALTVADIGDSAGTHLAYLEGLLAESSRLRGRSIRTVSVNSDPQAVERIRARGFEAMLCRAEEFADRMNLQPALLLSFETLEHLTDPISFLDTLSRRDCGRLFVVTVPYVKVSRVGLRHIRDGSRTAVCAEDTHIFELCPGDWRLVFRHAGWRVAEDQVYYQYPKHPAAGWLRPLWRVFDFEGFYGAILERDRTWAELYRDEIPQGAGEKA